MGKFEIAHISLVSHRWSKRYWTDYVIEIGGHRTYVYKVCKDCGYKELIKQ